MFLRFVRLMVVAAMVVGLASGAAFAWQGRMAGMGDPYGLVADQSDFLIHPSFISDSRAQNIFADYRFTYGSIDWDWSATLSRPTTIPLIGITIDGGGGRWNADGGEKYKHDAGLGIITPLGQGMGGFFVNYKGTRSDFDGTSGMGGFIGANSAGISTDFNMKSDTDDFTFKAIYGQPIGCEGNLKWGAELSFSYHKEENRLQNALTGITVNNAQVLPTTTLFQTNDFLGMLYPFMMPKDMEYWSFDGKTGIDGNLGPVKLGVTVRGGAFFSGDNTWGYSDVFNSPEIPVSLSNRFDLQGDVNGYRFGGDVWARYPLNTATSIPFSFRIDYMEKERTGNGNGVFTYVDNNTAINNSLVRYNSDGREESWNIEVGGGVDHMLSDRTKLAAGLYYNYINAKSALSLIGSYPNIPIYVELDYNEYPTVTEHLVRFKAAAEHKYSDTTSARAGLEVFGGPSEQVFAFLPGVSGATLASNGGSLSGTHWGIVGSIGATFKAYGWDIEPFVQAGYQSLSIEDSTGSLSVLNIPVLPWDLQQDRSEVIIAAGFSVRF